MPVKLPVWYYNAKNAEKVQKIIKGIDIMQLYVIMDV